MKGMAYDALVLVSFGGPEGPDDVMPFLRNVTRGRDVPEHRLIEVAEHYQRFGGISPINQQCRALLDAIKAELVSHNLDLPCYWGNRNWHPYLADCLQEMADAGIRTALAFVTSPYGSYSSCRQYLEDIEQAIAQVGPSAPRVDKLRHFHDHPGFIQPHVDAIRAAVAGLPASPDAIRLVFTAHSIPVTMALASGPPGCAGRYQAQLAETAALVAARAAPQLHWDLVWQSRSGSPRVPWLGPDIEEHLTTLRQAGAEAVVVGPIGFISDHLEVVWDLDIQAAAQASRLGLGFARAATPGVDPRFVTMIRELVEERVGQSPRRRLGQVPTWDACPAGCCPARP
jgi:ferrochelatase